MIASTPLALLCQFRFFVNCASLLVHECAEINNKKTMRKVQFQSAVGVALLNIRLPILLGELVNVMAEFVNSDGQADMSALAPIAGKLISCYGGQVENFYSLSHSSHGFMYIFRPF
jgi:hypothetical protein